MPSDSRTRFQGQRVLFDFGFGSIGERRVDRFAFKPVGELIAIMFAAGLAGFSAGDQHDGVVPIGQVSHESFGGAMMAAGGARAPFGSGLRLTGNAEKLFQNSVAANGMSMSK